MANTQKGLVGFSCEVTEQPVLFQDCLACAKRGAAPGCSMVPAVILAAISSIRDPNYADNLAVQAGADIGFSVTELLGCPRQTRLKAENPYYEKPSSMYRMNRGSGYHAMLAASSTSGIAEKTLTWKFTYRGKSVLLVGTPDLIEWTPQGWYITDYKVTGKAPYGSKIPKCPHCGGDVYKDGKDFYCTTCIVHVKNRHAPRVYIPPQARSSHVAQVNLYALLIEKNLHLLQSLVPQATATFAGAQIVYLPDDKPVRIQVNLDRDAAMALLKSRLAALLATDLPPVLEEVDELWRCDYCPVRAICEQHHGGPVGKERLLAMSEEEPQPSV